MGRKKEKTTSKKEDEDEEVLCSTTRKSERLIAANAAVAAAAPKTAAAAAPAAVSPTATATDALPPVILEGRFEGYMSPSYVAAHKREYYKFCWDNAREDFTFWQDKAFDELREHSMRRQKMLDEVRSTRTGAAAAAAAADDPAAAAAAAAAAEDTLAAAAAADTATKAAAATIARLEQELGEMTAAAATTTAAANATATAAAEETARLQHELDEMTHWLWTAYTPQVIYPTPMDQREMDKWAAWCNSIQWGTNTVTGYYVVPCHSPQTGGTTPTDLPQPQPQP